MGKDNVFHKSLLPLSYEMIQSHWEYERVETRSDYLIGPGDTAVIMNW